MKKIVSLLIIVIILALVFDGVYIKNKSTDSVTPKTHIVPETNLGGLSILRHPENTITYGYGTTESIPDNPIFLYINGSIKNTHIVIENGVIFVPLRLVAESIGAKVYWYDETNKVYITDGDNKIVLAIGDDKPTLNDSVIPIDVAPKTVNDDTYVSLSFITELLNCQVSWYDGNPVYNGDGIAPQEAHYPIGEQQVMVSRYPTDAKALREIEAIQKLKEQLIVAYENSYGIKFKSLASEPKIWDAQSTLRYSISNLSISYENDRFFVIQFGWSFMVDKYTGTVFLCHNGVPETINIFNPYSPGALAFAG